MNVNPRTRRLARIVLGAWAVCVARPAPAQQADTTAAADLPAALAEEVVGWLNDPSIAQRDGDVLIAAGERQEGAIAVLDGDLTVGGTVAGDVYVVNGDVQLEPGAVIAGNLTVVGGEVENLEASTVTGEVVIHSGIFAYERVEGRVRYLRGPRPASSLSDRGGTADFLVTTGKSYNRVEGMPIAFGPRLQTAGSNPLRLQALAVYRSESGLSLDTDLMGYYVRADQYLGGRRELRVGATLHSVIDPIEEWHLSDLESGLATFLFHRDYRDHYQRKGWSASAAWEPRGTLRLVQLEWRWETHQTRPSGSPWSLFRNAEEWRPQPVIAEGKVGTLSLRTEYDSRTSSWNPAGGLLIKAQLEQVVSGSLTYPEVVDAATLDPVTFVDEARYGKSLTGLIDLRSYNRVNAVSRLNLRLVAGGSLTGDPLPPQRQSAIGGEGSLPGYSLFSGDCAARASRVRLVGPDGSARPDDLHPHYGCDAFGLLQAEFRGKLSFRFRWDAGPWREGSDESDRVWDFGWDMAPDWALFVDAGRGWAFHDRPSEDTLVNVGAGLLLDRIGVYVAVPVSGGSGANLFIRLGPRF